MLDHIGIGVTDLQRSVEFFSAVLAPLDIEVVLRFPHAVGLGRAGAASLWLGKTNEKVAPLHLAFQAASRQQVDEFYECALRAGARDNGAPGLRTHYHPEYYAAFVFGPDGHNVEAVCRKAS